MLDSFSSNEYEMSIAASNFVDFYNRNHSWSAPPPGGLVQLLQIIPIHISVPLAIILSTKVVKQQKVSVLLGFAGAKSIKWIWNEHRIKLCGLLHITEEAQKLQIVTFKSLILFENHPKCLIWIFQFWHFPPIFVLLKLTCLVTLFDRKLHLF